MRQGVAVQPSSGPVRSCLMPSTVIRRFSYDAVAHRLDITFVSGRQYSYHGVPPEVADGMARAFSKGSYFNAEIRDRFPFSEQRRQTRVGA